MLVMLVSHVTHSKACPREFYRFAKFEAAKEATLFQYMNRSSLG